METLTDKTSLFTPLQEEHMRFRRNIVNRFNVAQVLGPAITSGDIEGCFAACESYSTNERQRAIDDLFRGPTARNRNLRSGFFTLYFRYFQLYEFLLDFCNGFCDRIERKSQIIKLL